MPSGPQIAEAESSAPAVPQSFADLLRAHQSMVFSIALQFLRDRSAAEEVAQDVFLQLHRCLARLESNEHIRFWLRKTTSHRCIDYIRKRNLHPAVALEDIPDFSIFTPPSDPLLSRKLNRLIANLPEQARLVMILRYGQDLGPDEIAETLSIPVRTVKSHLQRSLATLREKLNRMLGGSANG